MWCRRAGVLTYKDGRRYEGEYKLDKMHGRGVYIWAEGARYEGEYREDKKNGRGVQTWPSGARYEGEYIDSMQTGYGLMTWADGRRYEGYWVNSKCTGFGILSHKDGRRYEGGYVNDKMQGKVTHPSDVHPLQPRLAVAWTFRVGGVNKIASHLDSTPPPKKKLALPALHDLVAADPDGWSHPFAGHLHVGKSCQVRWGVQGQQEEREGGAHVARWIRLRGRVRRRDADGAGVHGLGRRKGVPWGLAAEQVHWIRRLDAR